MSWLVNLDSKLQFWQPKLNEDRFISPINAFFPGARRALDLLETALPVDFAVACPAVLAVPAVHLPATWNHGMKKRSLQGNCPMLFTFSFFHGPLPLVPGLASVYPTAEAQHLSWPVHDPMHVIYDVFNECLSVSSAQCFALF